MKASSFARGSPTSTIDLEHETVPSSLESMLAALENNGKSAPTGRD